jgi:hypothetical protein
VQIYAEAWLALSEDIWARTRERTNMYTTWHVHAEDDVTIHYEESNTNKGDH